jgi:uncharacterized protein with PIN domain
VSEDEYCPSLGSVLDDEQEEEDEPLAKKQKIIIKTSDFCLYNDEVQCYFCGENCQTEDIKEHLTKVHFLKPNANWFGEPRPFRCSKCGGTYSTQYKLGT